MKNNVLKTAEHVARKAAAIAVAVPGTLAVFAAGTAFKVVSTVAEAAAEVVTFEINTIKDIVTADLDHKEEA